MELEQAIRVLVDILRYVKPADPPEEHSAIRLGIEALKRVKLDRNLPYPVISDMLPGETTHSQ